MGSLAVIPKVVEIEARSFALEVIGELFLGAVAPEFFLPLIALQSTVGLIPGSPKDAAIYQKYLTVAKDLTQTVDQVLDIIVKLQMLGIIPASQDNSTTLQQKLVDSLYCLDEDGHKVGLACIVRQALHKRITVDGTLTDFNVIDFLQELIKDLRWDNGDGHVFTLGESLGRLLFTGIVGQYQPH